MDRGNQLSRPYDLEKILGKEFTAYMCEGTSTSLILSDNFSDKLFQLIYGRPPVTIPEILFARRKFSWNPDLSLPFIDLADVMLIREWQIGPALDETKTAADFNKFPPIIRKMSWDFVSLYVPSSVEDYPDWPLLCHCAQALQTIADHYGFDLSDGNLPITPKSLPS